MDVDFVISHLTIRYFDMPDREVKIKEDIEKSEFSKGVKKAALARLLK